MCDQYSGGYLEYRRGYLEYAEGCSVGWGHHEKCEVMNIYNICIMISLVLNMKNVGNLNIPHGTGDIFAHES